MYKKTCSKCGTEYEGAQFYRNKNATDGLTSHCRHCAKQYRATNAERAGDSTWKWREENRARYNAQQRVGNRMRKLRQDLVQSELVEAQAASDEAAGREPHWPDSYVPSRVLRNEMRQVRRDYETEYAPLKSTIV